VEETETALEPLRTRWVKKAVVTVVEQNVRVWCHDIVDKQVPRHR
jgi:hypothetical protein